jgi:hypothetical protein
LREMKAQSGDDCVDPSPTSSATGSFSRFFLG